MKKADDKNPISEKVTDRELLEQKHEMQELRLFSNTQACEMLGVSAVKLWRERSARRISFRRLAGSIRFTAADLIEYLERCKQEAI